MLLRLFRLFFVASLFPVIASTPYTPHKPVTSTQENAVFLLAQKAMPLPVVRVRTWTVGEGKRRFMVEMSTAGLEWAKKPFCRVMFQTSNESGNDFEQALHEASAFAKSFIEAAKDKPALQTERWY